MTKLFLHFKDSNFKLTADGYY